MSSPIRSTMGLISVYRRQEQPTTNATDSADWTHQAPAPGPGSPPAAAHSEDEGLSTGMLAFVIAFSITVTFVLIFGITIWVLRRRRWRKRLIQDASAAATVAQSSRKSTSSTDSMESLGSSGESFLPLRHDITVRMNLDRTAYPLPVGEDSLYATSETLPAMSSRSTTLSSASGRKYPRPASFVPPRLLSPVQESPASIFARSQERG